MKNNLTLVRLIVFCENNHFFGEEFTGFLHKASKQNRPEILNRGEKLVSDI